VYTNRTGEFLSRFRVPGSQPGIYQIAARIQGVSYASARYTVASMAVLSVSVSSSPGVDTFTISGRRFVSHEKLVLLAFPVAGGNEPISIGNVRCGRHGRFTYVRAVASLPPGQYVLRALSTDTGSLQMADTFFSVIT
jgi:hypothetical protein